MAIQQSLDLKATPMVDSNGTANNIELHFN
jgi:hypothetical protein